MVAPVELVEGVARAEVAQVWVPGRGRVAPALAPVVVEAAETAC
jgi:hypothetical protein